MAGRVNARLEFRGNSHVYIHRDGKPVKHVHGFKQAYHVLYGYSLAKERA
jgi:hypothetical protein